MLSEEEFIAQAKKHYQKIKKLSRIESSYNYEKEFDEIWSEFGRETIQKSISEVPNDRRKKKLMSLRGDRDKQ